MLDAATRGQRAPSSSTSLRVLCPSFFVSFTSKVSFFFPRDTHLTKYWSQNSEHRVRISALPCKKMVLETEFIAGQHQRQRDQHRNSLRGGRGRVGSGSGTSLVPGDRMAKRLHRGTASRWGCRPDRRRGAGGRALCCGFFYAKGWGDIAFIHIKIPEMPAKKEHTHEPRFYTFDRRQDAGQR